MPTKVLLVEDHVSYRDSFRLALTRENDFQVVGEAGRSHDVPLMVEQTKPDLVVIDFLLPDGNGISLVREFKRRRVRVKTVILGRIGHPTLVQDALQAGVGGLVHKQEPLEVVTDALKRVMAGERYFSPLLRRQMEENAGAGLPLSQLSAREREILFLVIEGQSSKEIGNALFLSAKTVDAHRLHINRKFGVRTPAALTRFVVDQGLLGQTQRTPSA
jgi:DNA-binding NarL/FixJ family response regulator